MTHGEFEDADLVPLPDGRRAQVWQGGAPVGPVVFFLHGCPDCRLAARSGDAAARRAGVRLVAVNRPGYGRSDPHESGHASVADDIVAVADRLGIERFALLGMSVGGPYALACAARHPGRVTSVGVVAGPAVVPELDPPWHRDDLSPQQQAFFARLAAGTVTDAVMMLRPDFEAYVQRLAPHDEDDVALARRLTQGLHPQDAELLDTLPAADVAEMTREALAQLDGYLRDAAVTFRPWEVRPEQVRCPAWLWYGELDSNVSVRNGQWLTEHLPDATLVVREGSAHLATLLDHWPEILTTLLDGPQPSGPQT
jgi:pimeloyl-ACP methyl ester carboxylesterase